MPRPRKQAAEAFQASLAIPAPQNPFVVPCAWEGADGPCLLPGTVGRGRYDGDKAYCSWHGAFVIHGRDMRAIGDRDEFERWLEGRRKAGYEGVFAHYDSSSLWFATQGVASLGQPRPCGRPDCRLGAKEQGDVPF